MSQGKILSRGKRTQVRASDQLTFAAFPSMRQNHDDGSWEGVAQPFRLGQHCLKLRPIPPPPSPAESQRYSGSKPGVARQRATPGANQQITRFNRNAVAPSITSPPTPPFPSLLIRVNSCPFVVTPLTAVSDLLESLAPVCSFFRIHNGVQFLLNSSGQARKKE